jgi:hypothetical protein
MCIRLRDWQLLSLLIFSSYQSLRLTLQHPAASSLRSLRCFFWTISQSGSAQCILEESSTASFQSNISLLFSLFAVTLSLELSFFYFKSMTLVFEPLPLWFFFLFIWFKFIFVAQCAFELLSFPLIFFEEPPTNLPFVWE